MKRFTISIVETPTLVAEQGGQKARAIVTDFGVTANSERGAIFAAGASIEKGTEYADERLVYSIRAIPFEG